MEVRSCLGVDDQDVATGLDVAAQQLVWPFDHEMCFERHAHPRPTRRNDVWSECEVRNEMSVHHIPLNAVYARLLELDDLVAQPAEIGRKHGRHDGNRAGHIRGRC